ncbi:MAG: UDP-glucose/GDP-mannose dehydrogenase family protein [Thaumarchaeota archaeon]|nr:UDP-glucose/GDP-mannose dehydrogenase family protein [Nitrososphaerota archaeon]
MSKVSIFGLGRVGLITAVCLADRGIEVAGFDVDEKKMAQIARGEAPFYEPQLEEMLKKSLKTKKFTVSDNPVQVIGKTDTTMIAVGTPVDRFGHLNLTFVEEAAKLVGKAIGKKKDGYHLVVVRSTILPGTTLSTVRRTLEKASGKKCGEDFGLCMSPEFLKEGTAITDTLKPDRVIVGAYDQKSAAHLEKIYREFYGENPPPIVTTSLSTAELIKYASNAFLAAKISFINEIANICEDVESADVLDVARGIGLDKRIGSQFLRPGLGYGGSCLPKDLRALLRFAKDADLDAPLLVGVGKVNDTRPVRATKLLEKSLGDLKGRNIAILGLAFKPETDDLREAVSIKIVKRLLRKGASVKVHDPVVEKQFREIFGDRIYYSNSAVDCVKNTEGAIIVTEWNEYTHLKPKDFTQHMKKPIVIDGRRALNDPEWNNQTTVQLIRIGAPSKDR